MCSIIVVTVFFLKKKKIIEVMTMRANLILNTPVQKIDLGKLEIAALWRYLRHFNIVSGFMTRKFIYIFRWVKYTGGQ